MTQPVGIVLQAGSGRYGREQLDVPLAIASMDFKVQVFLLAEAVYQLIPEQTGELAWTRLWKAFRELETEIFIQERTAQMLAAAIEHLPVKPVVMTDAQMAAALSNCRCLIHV